MNYLVLIRNIWLQLRPKDYKDIMRNFLHVMWSPLGEAFFHEDLEMGGHGAVNDEVTSGIGEDEDV